MTLNQVRKATYARYFELNIHQRINARQSRNGLNINYLFGTTMSNVGMGFLQPSDITHPRVNNGLYHHIGKNHSQYPKEITRTNTLFPESSK